MSARSTRAQSTENDKLALALRLLERYASFFLVAWVVLLMLLGKVGGEADGWPALGFVALFIAYSTGRLAFLGYSHVHAQPDSPRPLRALEAAILVVTFASLIVHISGGAGSWLVPVVYLAGAVVASSFRKAPAVLGTAWLLVLELALRTSKGGLDHPETLVAHALFILVFSLLNVLMFRFGTGIERQKARTQVQRILGDIQADARRLRVEDVVKPEHAVAADPARRELYAYFEMKDVLRDALRQLAIPLGAYTVAALWYDPRSRTLKVAEADSPSAVITGREFAADQGLLHGVVASGSSLRMSLTDTSRRTIGYYRDVEPVNALCAAPIGDKETLAGVLVVDRSEARAFTDPELEIVQLVARQIWRAMVNEGLLRRLDKSRQEHYHLAEASKALSRVYTEAEVLRVSLEETAKIAPYDLGAVVMCDPEQQQYEIVACWPKSVDLTGVTFSGQGNLVDWVIRRNQPLAYPNFANLPRRPVIFTREERLSNVSSLLVLPLNVKAQTVGAFVLASGQAEFFGEDLQHIFQIIANQIAVSLENAQIYTRLEEMATIDGLTGLMNKRTLNERIEELISRAERYDHPVSLLMMDIDHFKRVNDTYGHLAGDRVLREVGRVLRESMRRIDLVGRWGGEEFMVLLDSTSAEDARDKAEQLRERVGSLVFDSDLGEFSVTLSAGIATFPEDSRRIDELVEKADVALYQSKRAGRNRVTLYAAL